MCRFKTYLVPERYVQYNLGTVLAQGVANAVTNLHTTQILDIKTESPDLLSALTTLSTFYHDNTPAARRHLRFTIEQRGLDIHGRFLTAAETVIKVPSTVLPARACHHAYLRCSMRRLCICCCVTNTMPARCSFRMAGADRLIS